MTPTKLTEVVRFYRHWLDQDRGAGELETPDAPASYDHLCWMCGRVEEQMEGYAAPPREAVEKGMRWLGYVQGVLAARGDFTLDELRAHSRTEAGSPGAPERRLLTRVTPYAALTVGFGGVFLGKGSVLFDGAASCSYARGVTFRVTRAPVPGTTGTGLVMTYAGADYDIGMATPDTVYDRVAGLADWAARANAVAEFMAAMAPSEPAAPGGEPV